MNKFNMRFSHLSLRSPRLLLRRAETIRELKECHAIPGAVDNLDVPRSTATLAVAVAYPSATVTHARAAADARRVHRYRAARTATANTSTTSVAARNVTI